MPITAPINPEKGGRNRECTEALQDSITRLMDEAIALGWTKGEVQIALVHTATHNAAQDHSPEYNVPAPSGAKH